ncbi:signal peptidase I [Sedimentisphaera salicampi]|uniref:signal peptidase I n=1 Tax=Sedimentisphaera salicampi TaxID=1941349 RepID=UPI0013747907|nr:signal peptidase I [Sedimentisphaera salicampi]
MIIPGAGLMRYDRWLSGFILLVIWLLIPDHLNVLYLISTAGNIFLFRHLNYESYRNSKKRLLKIAIQYPLLILCLNFLFSSNLFFAVDNCINRTDIMAPQVESGEQCLVNLIAYAKNVPEAGDLVVYSEELYLGQAAGLPGDTIVVRDNKLLINGKPAEFANIPSKNLGRLESWAASAGGKEFFGVGEKYTVPEGCVFLVCNKPDKNISSFTMGAVRIDSLYGKVIYIMNWPWLNSYGIH